MNNRQVQCPVPTGALLVIGGHEDKGDKHQQDNQSATSKPLEILETFLSLIGKDNPTIELITSASSESDETFKDYKIAFKKLGAASVGHIHHNKRSELDEHSKFEKRLQSADGIFFSGGDQLKLTSIYGGSKFLLALKNRYIHDGLILAGTSAGAMAFSTPMIFAGNKERQQVTGQVKITTGLEFLKDVCIDTHFVDRSRFVRMAQVITTNPTSIGIGIEENTAIIVRNGTTIDVVGSGEVIIIEGYEITDSNILEYDSGKTFAVRDLKVHILSEGSKYCIKTLNPPHI